MVTLLVILAVLAWIVGSLMLTQATYGVGILAAGCLLAILARVAQSREQHREMASLMRQGLGLPLPTTSSGRPGAWVCSQCHHENGAGLFDCPHCGTARPRG